MLIGIIIILCIILVFYILASFVLPRLVLCKPNVTKPFGVGKRVYHVEDKKTILYEPTEYEKDYISEYIIQDTKEGRILTCKAEKKIEDIDYDIYLFNGNGKFYKAITVHDPLEDKPYTNPITLPVDASVASIHVTKANGEANPHILTPYNSYKTHHAVLFLIISDILLAIACFLVFYIYVYNASDVFYDKIMNGSILLYAAISCIAILVVINTILLRQRFLKRLSRKEVRSR